MFDALSKIGEIITAILGFFQGIIDTVSSFISSVSAWWDSVLVILQAMPASILTICIAAFALLVAFIVIELLRDFL